jgi:hypothetical protein
MAASWIAAGPPSDAPKSQARSIPAASRIVSTSRAAAATLPVASSRSDRPKPRRSNTTTVKRRANAASARRIPGCSQAISMCDTKPDIKTRASLPAPISA